jgi:TPR repeat protein
MNNSSAVQNVEQIRNEAIVLFGKENLSELIEKLELLVSLDDSWGMHYLASCYSNGVGVEVNPEISNQLYIKAAEKGFTDSQAVLGHKYLFGFQINKDISKGMELLKLAAANNNAYSNFLLAEQYLAGNSITTKDVSAGLIYMEKAEELGDHRAKQRLAYFYKTGLYVEKDFVKSLELNIESADLGNEFATFNAGQAFEYGVGTEVDYKKAIHYYQIAADMNIVMAMHNLGALYFNGHGTERDLDKAHQWYLRAANFGSHLSSLCLSDMDKKGERRSKSISMAVVWCLIAIEQKNLQAINELENLKKELTDDDNKEIIHYLTAFAEKGLPWAQSALSKVYQEGLFCKADMGNARKWNDEAEKSYLQGQDLFSIQN